MLKQSALLLIYCYSALLPAARADLHGLYTILHFLVPNILDLGPSRGQSVYSFQHIVTQYDQHYCTADDEHIQHILYVHEPTRKPPIMLKCLQPKPEINATVELPTVHIMNSVKDIITLLKPVGNATKRHEAGNCVIVLFCTPSSLGCSVIAPIANALPYAFPTLRVAYIDALKFPNYNAEFGIVGVPTLVLFHQGRPVLKSYSNQNTYHAFITRHTGIRPRKVPAAMQLMDEPLPLTPIVTTDYYILFAWCFIGICLLNRMRYTIWWKQIVEMVQRNWRESEETQMGMND